MKNFLITAFTMLIFAGISCTTQSEKKQTVTATSGNDVEVYYFHMTTRCVTCKTIEAEARKNIEMLYPEQVKTGKISFTVLNVEESPGKDIGAELGVNSQALLIVKGDQKINITSEGFLYASSKPDRFKEIIREKVDSLMK
jgi:hypothetical protein